MKLFRHIFLEAMAILLFAAIPSCSKDSSVPKGTVLSCVQPPFLSPGDKVALLSPSYFTPMENVYKAADVIREWGFEPVIGPNVGKTHLGKYGGTPEERISDLQWAMNDPSIKAIICNRGGYGTIRFVDLLPKDTFSADPKWLVGFSDITTIHEIETMTGVMSIHGTMGSFLAKTGGKDPSSQILRDLLTGTVPSYSVPAHPENIPGKATGTLVGGNLCTFSPVLGTWADATSGKDIILFIEEVEEDMSHLDRLINTLVLNGVFDRCKGVILGEFSDCGANLDWGSVEEMICSYLKRYHIPVLCGFPAGHDETNFPLVMGASVTIEVGPSESTLSFNIEGKTEPINTAIVSRSYSDSVPDGGDPLETDKQSKFIRALNFMRYYDGPDLRIKKGRIVLRDSTSVVFTPEDSLSLEDTLPPVDTLSL